jgi:hypothetical protein
MTAGRTLGRPGKDERKSLRRTERVMGAAGTTGGAVVTGVLARRWPLERLATRIERDAPDAVARAQLDHDRAGSGGVGQ